MICDVFIKGNLFYLDNLLKKTDTTPLESAREWEMEMVEQELQQLVHVSIIRIRYCSTTFFTFSTPTRLIFRFGISIFCERYLTS